MRLDRALSMAADDTFPEHAKAAGRMPNAYMTFAMRRVHCSEIHEQGWFPQRLRDDVTDTLQFIFNAARFYRPIAARLGAALRATGSDRVLDLCSGAGGPWIWLQATLAEQAAGPRKVILTDRYPNLAAFHRAQEASRDAIGYCAESVDAQKVPPGLSGFRTIFSSIHHFTPNQITAILRDAVDRGEGIGFFEAAKRRPRTVLYACLMPVATICLAPFMRPFRFTRLIWTYVLPVIPFVMLFDGVLSCLRAYSPAELHALAAGVGAKHYTWDAGEASAVTYLIGYAA
jgi:hypothetical protein